VHNTKGSGLGLSLVRHFDQGESVLLAIGDIAGKGLLAGMWFTHLLGLTRTFGEDFAGSQVREDDCMLMVVRRA
jgi:serine phosphatase RsbU (regulator of sigma subunit)